MRHLIDFGDLSRAEWEALYQKTSAIIDHPADFMDACRGRVAATLFFEPSTRTNFSFQTAARCAVSPTPTPPRWPRASA